MTTKQPPPSTAGGQGTRRGTRRRYPSYLEAHKSPDYDTEPIFAALLDEVLAAPGKTLREETASRDPQRPQTPPRS